MPIFLHSAALPLDSLARLGAPVVDGQVGEKKSKECRERTEESKGRQGKGEREKDKPAVCPPSPTEILDPPLLSPYLETLACCLMSCMQVWVLTK